MIVPVPIFTNYLGWADKLSENPKTASAISIITGVIYELVTFFIFIIIDSA